MSASTVRHSVHPSAARGRRATTSATSAHNVTFGGQVGTVGHINIGANSVYAARSGIIGDMPEGVFCAGFPVQPHAEWLRVQAAVRRLPEMVKKIKSLEKEIEGLRRQD